MNNFVTRLLTGVLTSAIVITSVWYSDWGFFIIFLIAQFFCQLEFYKIIGQKIAKPLTWLGLIIGTFSYIFTFLRFHFPDTFDIKYFALLFPLTGIIFLVELYRKKEQPFANIGYTILGIVYASLPFTLFLHIAYNTAPTGYSPQIVLGVLLMLWASDSGAYFAGRTLGKTKLFERISPKKTWEGSIGGLVLSLLFAYGISIYWLDLALWQWLCMSAIIVIIGGYGDLVESLMKRSMQIKDSSNFLPGHGGFLDRFDGLILALPFLACFLILAI